MNDEPGLFVISLDTELAWGSFDTGEFSQHETAYQNTRSVIQDLCSLFDAYNMPTTWALVMHLLEDCDGHSQCPRPQFEWVNWYDELPCITGVDQNIWHTPDILRMIESTKVEHEIGLHGYTHMILGDPGCTPEAAQYEINKAIQIANRWDIDPQTYIFPRNNIGHLDILSKSGLSYYRGVDSYWYEKFSYSVVQKPMRFIDETFKRAPPVVSPRRKEDGLVELPGSQILRPYNGPWKYSPKNSQLSRAKKGLSKAARTGNIFHLWFHPFNLSLNKSNHLNLVNDILAHASQLRRDGQIEFCTLAEAASRRVD